jgi:hypothetical protein
MAVARVLYAVARFALFLALMMVDWGSAFVCTALPSFGYRPTTPQPTCDAKALTPRRSPDGKISVVTLYRNAPALDRSAIFFGTKADALTRAQMSALVAAILSFASAGIAALCAAFVLF